MDRRGNDNVGILGDFIDDLDVLLYIRAQHLDTTFNGLGNPWAGMIYWNIIYHQYKYYDGTVWQFFPSGEMITLHRTFHWLLFNGAVAGTLAGGRITTSRLPVASAFPGIQFKVDEQYFTSGTDVIVMMICGHSTGLQTLDMDLDYTQTGVGLNLNTQPGEVQLNVTPITPAVPYDHFLVTFFIPGATVVAGRGLEIQISRDTGGADTGDLHVWEVPVYQLA